MNCKKISTLSLSLGLIFTPIVDPLPTLAHSTVIEYQATEAIAIDAKFDNGQPMANAQVVIYAPDNPTVAWSKGMTDETGQFSFIPDYQQTGNWTVKIRLAGHGSVINIPIESSVNSNVTANKNNPQTIFTEDQTTFTSAVIGNNQNSNLSWSQKLLMTIAGGWGCVGTALYFSRKNKTLN